MNSDIPNFEGKVDVDAVDNWLSKLEWYFSPNNFFTIEKITFSLLKAENHIKLAWETRVLNKESEAGEELEILSDKKPTWGEFVGYIKESYLLEDVYENKYTELKLLQKKRDNLCKITPIHSMHSLQNMA